MSAAIVVLKKELRDHLRDRRSLLSALLMPILGPVIFAFTFGLVAKSLKADKPVEIALVNGADAPSLVQWLERHGAHVKAAPADYEEQIRDGKLDVALVVDKDYATEMAAARAGPVKLVFDGSRTRAALSVSKAQKLLQAFSGELGAFRLLARGVSPQLAAPLALEEANLASPQKSAAQLLGMVPLFLLVAAFVGGMHLAIDATAGERERGSLEPLLINPVRPGEVVLGKWLATVLVTWGAVSVTMLGFLVVLRRMPLADLGIRARIEAPEALGMLAVVLPVTLLAAGIQMLISVFARTFKEGQTYASLLSLIPMLPGFLLMFSPGKPALWMAAVPVLGQTMLMNGILRAEPAPALYFAVAAATTMLLAAVCVGVTRRMLGSERVIFGR